MKQIAPNYTYNKTTGVITLTGVNIDRDQLLLIVNTTRNVTYYNFADSATTLQAFTQGANTSITLASSIVSASSAHTNADALTIYYDDQVSSGAVTVGNSVNINSLPSIRINPNYNGQDGNNGPVVEADSNLGTDPRYMVVAGGFDNNNQEFRSLAFDASNALKVAGTVAATDLGVKADAVATTDTGTFSVIAFIKRGLQNWTSLLAKIPALVSGRIPVDGSGVTQPISGTVTANAGDTSFFVSGLDVYAHRSVLYSSSGNGFANDDGAPVDIDNPLPISGTVNTYPQQGTTVTNTNFTSTTSATLVSAVANREVLTVFNEGAGTLFINVGSSASTTSYQVRLQSGEYWEAPAGQLSLQHSAIFGSAGTARVTEVS